MKKIVLIAAVFLTLVGCKQQSKDKASEEVAVATADSIDPCTDLDNARTVQEYEQWIQRYRTVICDGNLDECILKQHKTSFTDYYDMLKNYWGTNAPNYKSVTWRELKTEMGAKCYPYYLGFVFTGRDQIDRITTLPQFDTNGKSYSFPLFRAIDKANGGLKDDDTFVFVMGKKINPPSGVVDRVMFCLEIKATGATSFFDISDNPTK